MRRPSIGRAGAVLVVGCCGVVGMTACGAPGADGSPFAVEVIEFSPGDGAGYGSDAMPDVVLGPPDGGKDSLGSLDVVSLGRGGSITVRLGRVAVDVDGPDLVVFENPFFVAGGDAVFAEPGAVSVSDDGVDFVAFACAPDAVAEGPPNVSGCAGVTPVLANADNGFATDPSLAGGDAFDLARIGVARASFVRITDVGTGAVAPNAGFDLDAVAVVAPGVQ